MGRQKKKPLPRPKSDEEEEEEEEDMPPLEGKEKQAKFAQRKRFKRPPESVLNDQRTLEDTSLPMLPKTSSMMFGPSMQFEILESEKKAKHAMTPADLQTVVQKLVASQTATLTLQLENQTEAYERSLQIERIESEQRRTRVQELEEQLTKAGDAQIRAQEAENKADGLTNVLEQRDQELQQARQQLADLQNKHVLDLQRIQQEEQATADAAGTLLQVQQEKERLQSAMQQQETEIGQLRGLIASSEPEINVRDAAMDNLHQEIKGNEATIGKLQQNLATATRDALAQKHALEGQLRQAEELRGELQSTRALVETLQKEIQRLTGMGVQVKGERDAARNELQATQGRRDTTEAALQKATQELAVKTAELKAAQDAGVIAEQRLDEARKQAERDRKTVDDYATRIRELERQPAAPMQTKGGGDKEDKEPNEDKRKKQEQAGDVAPMKDDGGDKKYERAMAFVMAVVGPLGPPREDHPVTINQKDWNEMERANTVDMVLFKDGPVQFSEPNLQSLMFNLWKWREQAYRSVWKLQTMYGFLLQEKNNLTAQLGELRLRSPTKHLCANLDDTVKALDHQHPEVYAQLRAMCADRTWGDVAAAFMGNKYLMQYPLADQLAVILANRRFYPRLADELEKLKDAFELFTDIVTGNKGIENPNPWTGNMWRIVIDRQRAIADVQPLPKIGSQHWTEDAWQDVKKYRDLWALIKSDPHLLRYWRYNLSSPDEFLVPLASELSERIKRRS